MSDQSNTGTDVAADSEKGTGMDSDVTGTDRPDTVGSESWAKREEEAAAAEYERLKTAALKELRAVEDRARAVAKAVEDSKLVKDLRSIIALAAGHNAALAEWENSPAGKAHLEVIGGEAVGPTGKPDTEAGAEAGDVVTDRGTATDDEGNVTGPVNTGGTVVSSETSEGSSTEETGGGTSASPGKSRKG